MVKHTTKHWDDKFSAKPSQITLVDQEKKNGKELNNVWNVMKRFVDHPANEELPAVHRVMERRASCGTPRYISGLAESWKRQGS